MLNNEPIYAECIDLTGLIDAWFFTPGRKMMNAVWFHRQRCWRCRQNAAAIEKHHEEYRKEQEGND